MDCAECGTHAASDAKFCANCGADLVAQRAATEADAPAGELDSTPVTEAPETRPAGFAPAFASTAEPTPVATGDTATAAPAASTPAATAAPSATPARHATTRDDGAGNGFAAAILPILRTPIVVVTAAAALLALVLSLVASTVVNIVISLISDVELPESAGSWWDFAWTSHFTFNQVPFTTDEVTYAVSGFLLVAIPLAACALAFRLAPKLVARTSVSPHDQTMSLAAAPTRTAIIAFALTYAVLNLILGAFGPDEIGIAFVLGLLITFSIAALGAGVPWLVARSHIGNLRRTFLTDPPAPQRDAGMLRRAWYAISIPTMTFAAMVVAASVLTLVANVVQHATADEGRRPAITRDVTNMLDEGWTTVGYGVLASTSTDLETDNDSIFDDNDIETQASVRAWDLRGDDTSASQLSPVAGLGAGGLDIVPFLIVLIAAFGSVVLGGLYAGYRVARATGSTGSQQKAALAGAIVGPTWAAIAFVMTLVVTDRWSVDSNAIEGGFTKLDGVEVFFFTLLIGAVLGAVGGLVAAMQAQQSTTPTTTPPNGDTTDGGTPIGA